MSAMDPERLDRITSPDYLKHLEPGQLRLVVKRVREYVDHERARAERAEGERDRGAAADAQEMARLHDALQASAAECEELRARAERTEQHRDEEPTDAQLAALRERWSSLHTRLAKGPGYTEDLPEIMPGPALEAHFANLPEERRTALAASLAELDEQPEPDDLDFGNADNCTIPSDYIAAREQLERLLEAFWPDEDQVAYCLDPVGTKAEVDAALAKLVVLMPPPIDTPGVHHGDTSEPAEPSPGPCKVSAHFDTLGPRAAMRGVISAWGTDGVCDGTPGCDGLCFKHSRERADDPVAFARYGDIDPEPDDDDETDLGNEPVAEFGRGPREPGCTTCGLPRGHRQGCPRAPTSTSEPLASSPLRLFTCVECVTMGPACRLHGHWVRSDEPDLDDEPGGGS